MTGRLSRYLVLALAFAVASGCDDDDITSGQGAPSKVTVRAYVDANGSGTLDDGDVPLSGQEVTLTSTRGTVLKLMTNEFGLANFTDVPPGSYTATLAGTPPAGAILATASAPVIVAPFQGTEVAADFRFAFNPGTISGQLRRQGDNLPAPGIPVSLFSGTSATGDPIATATTDQQGAFSFPGLRPGQFTLQFDPFPTMTLVGGNTQTFTVGPEQTTAAAILFTGNLLLNIGEARQQDSGSPVAVEGVVTAGLGTFNARSLYLQDRSGGTLVFGVDTATVRPQVGDSIRVVGKVGFFNNEFQITSPVITVLGRGSAQTPRPVTGAEINAFSFQGELARATSLRVTAVSGSATSSSYNVTVEDNAGTSFVIRVANAGIGIPQTFFQIGSEYDVVGILNRFRTTAQLAPRSLADVTVAASPNSVLAARQATLGDTVQVEATVIAAQGTFRNDNIYVQDASGGIQVFGVPAGTDLQLGERIRINGVLGAFNNELQIVRFSSSSPLVITRLGTAPVPAPAVVTCARVISLADEGELLKLENVTVVRVPSSGTSYNITVRDAAGTECQVRIDGNVGQSVPRSSFEVGAAYDITGVLGNFRGTAQVKPRGTFDIVKR